MNNSSLHNEKLISLIMLNLTERKNTNKVQILRNTIFNQTIYPILNNLPSNKVPKKQSDFRINQSKALKILNKILPYKLAIFCSNNPKSDVLYGVINDFKFHLNSDFYTIFKTQ
jgi:hypothetical protein